MAEPQPTAGAISLRATTVRTAMSRLSGPGDPNRWVRALCTWCSAPGRSASPSPPGWPAQGVAVRTVSRHRPGTLADGVDWRAADATDPEAAADAAKGASVIYQCLNAPYTAWPKLFPPLQRGVLAAAERADALLVTLENIYAYGPTGGQAMTEDLPLAATTSKGRTRAAMTAELLAVGRSRPGPCRHRTGLGLLRCRGHRIHPGRPGVRQRPGRQAGRLHRQPRPAPHLQLRARHRRRSGHPGHATSGPSARSGTCPAPRPSPPGRSSIWSPPRSAIPSGSATSPSWPCEPWEWSTR